MGDIVHVDLPEVGTDFIKMDAISCVESTKSTADIYQMVDGEVVEVNEEVEADASVLNEDAEGKGWIMKVKLTNEGQLNELMDIDTYKTIIW